MKRPSDFDLRPERNVLILPAVVLAILLLGTAVAYVLPIMDKDVSTVSSTALPYSEKTLRGKQVYDAEGCWYCHTQQVRAVSSDLGLGKVTTAERIVRDRPNVLGLQRVGPDLACYGDRQQDVDQLVTHLQEPRGMVHISNMPSYSYLSSSELEDLSAYLVGLTCSADS